MLEKAKQLKTPLTRKQIESLKAGDWILLSGEIYTARDQVHRRLFDLINKRRKLPIKLKGEIIYYTGPTPAKQGRVIGSAGPTTSSRMDKYTPKLLELGLAATIGKGERSQAVKDAVKLYRGVYLASVGGAGAYLSERITKAKVVAWPELGAEAVYRLTIRDFPCLVAYDSQGRDYFESSRKKFQEE
jgi:fumarate hydratase subunit beta